MNLIICAHPVNIIGLPRFEIEIKQGGVSSERDFVVVRRMVGTEHRTWLAEFAAKEDAELFVRAKTGD